MDIPRQKEWKEKICECKAYFISADKMVFRILICGSNSGPARFLTLVSTFSCSALNVTIRGQDLN